MGLDDVLDAGEAGVAAVEVLLPVRVAEADPARARAAPGHRALLRDGAALLRAVFKKSYN